MWLLKSGNLLSSERYYGRLPGTGHLTLLPLAFALGAVDGRADAKAAVWSKFASSVTNCSLAGCCALNTPEQAFGKSRSVTTFFLTGFAPGFGFLGVHGSDVNHQANGSSHPEPAGTGACLRQLGEPAGHFMRM